jgi:hypothetical protein
LGKGEKISFCLSLPVVLNENSYLPPHQKRSACHRSLSERRDQVGAAERNSKRLPGVFNGPFYIAFDKLNEYRKRYITQLIEQVVGEASQLEKGRHSFHSNEQAAFRKHRRRNKRAAHI